MTEKIQLTLIINEIISDNFQFWRHKRTMFGYSILSKIAGDNATKKNMYEGYS